MSDSKVMTSEEAISKYVRSGDCIAFGGFSTNRRPYGLVREILRQKIDNLTVESGPAGGDVDLLIGNGAVCAINLGYIANPGYSMVSRRFRSAAENGSLPIEDYSLDAQTIAYHAAALGLPYVPVKNMLGSDLETKWGISEEERKKYPKLPKKKFIIQDNPFNPGDKLCLLPAPSIDVAVLHVQKASPTGLCRIEGASFQDIDIAMAAKHTIVSCEELISDEELRKDVSKNSIPDICVDAVVYLPYGAHPAQCYGYYDYDPTALIEYDKASRNDETFAKYTDKYVFCSHDEYIGKIGIEHLKSLKVDKDYGYVKGLKRK